MEKNFLYEKFSKSFAWNFFRVHQENPFFPFVKLCILYISIFFFFFFFFFQLKGIYIKAPFVVFLDSCLCNLPILFQFINISFCNEYYLCLEKLHFKYIPNISIHLRNNISFSLRALSLLFESIYRVYQKNVQPRSGNYLMF